MMAWDDCLYGFIWIIFYHFWAKMGWYGRGGMGEMVGSRFYRESYDEGVDIYN